MWAVTCDQLRNLSRKGTLVGVLEEKTNNSMEGSVNQKIKDQIKVETLFEYLFELKE